MTDQTLMGGANGGQGSTDGGGQTDGGTGGTTDFTGPEWLKGIEGVDAEVIGDPSLKAIQDVPNLIKSFVNAQKMIGADKIILPKKDAEQSEWDGIFAKLGKPQELDAYTVTNPENSALDEDFLTSFKQAAFDANLLPAQAQKLFESINANELALNESFKATAQENFDKAIGDLKSDWGDAFEDKVRLSQSAAKEFGGEEFITYLNESGLGNNPELVKIFAKIGEGISKEDDLGGGPDRRRTGSLTPEEAKQKYYDVMNNPSDAYFHPDKAGHKARLEEVNKLFVAMG